MSTFVKLSLVLSVSIIPLGLYACGEDTQYQPAEEPIETITNEGRGSAEVGVDDSDPIEEE